MVYSEPDKRVCSRAACTPRWAEESGYEPAGGRYALLDAERHVPGSTTTVIESEYAAYRRIYFRMAADHIDTYGKETSPAGTGRDDMVPSDEQLADGYGHDNLRPSGLAGVGALKG